MNFALGGIRLRIHELASELFDLGPHHERAPELRRRTVALMGLAKAITDDKARNFSDLRAADPRVEIAHP